MLRFSPFYCCPEGKGTTGPQGPLQGAPPHPAPIYIRKIARDHPTLIRIVRRFFNVPQNYQHSRNCEKTRKFNHLQMKLQRQYFSPQLFKDPEYWSGRSLSQPGAQPSEPPVRA